MVLHEHIYLNIIIQTANLVGRTVEASRLKSVDYEKSEFKRKKMNKTVQVGEQVVTIEDLASDEASADYQRILTEKRGAALDDSFKDIEKLRDNVDS